jgi:hypothetical protein
MCTIGQGCALSVARPACIAFALRIALEVVYNALSWHSSDVLVRLQVYNAGKADHEKVYGSMHNLEKVGDTHTLLSPKLHQCVSWKPSSPEGELDLPRVFRK